MSDTPFKQLKKAAKKDLAKRFELGLAYYQGKVDKPDPEKDAKNAFKCFKKCAEKLKTPEADYYLALCYEKGFGVKNNYKKAVKYYRLAVASGHAESCVRLGYLYQDGLGVKKNEIEAFNMFSQADERGSINGRIAKADCYLNNRGAEKQDAEAAVKVYKELARTNVRAAYNFAYCYHTGQGVEKNTFMAAHYLVPAATRGDVNAQCFLAQCFFKGDCVKRNLPKAAYWFKKAASKGSDTGRFNYAYCLENGLGVERDPEKAVTIYEYLYKKGHLKAAAALARCYYYGFGTKQSLKKAVACAKAGAKDGDAECLCFMGWFRLNGIKCGKNRKKAYKLFAKSYAKGSPAAAYAMSVLALDRRMHIKDAIEKSAEYGKFAIDKQYPPAIYTVALQCDGAEREQMLELAAERDYLPAIVKYAKEIEQKDPKKAFRMWQRAYELGSLRGAFGLGRCYERGIGAISNRESAYLLFRQAAKSGYADAIAVVGQYFENGIVVRAADPKLAEQCYEVASKKGSTYAMCRMARKYAVKGKIKKAEKLYGEAIALGDKSAPLRLAEAYLLSRKKKYYHRALPILRTLVEEGEVRACAPLANVYDKIGKSADAAECADKMLQMGVNAHCANAYYYNAVRAIEARDVDVEYISDNLSKAMKYGSDDAARLALKLAQKTKGFKSKQKQLEAKEALAMLDQGDDYLYELGCAYESGNGVEKDEAKAAYFYATAYHRDAKHDGKALSKLKKYTEYDGVWMRKKSAKKAAKLAKKQAKADKKAANAAVEQTQENKDEAAA